jgi:hypothetical protein
LIKKVSFRKILYNFLLNFSSVSETKKKPD